MSRTLSLFLFIASLSVTISNYTSNSKHAAVSKIKDDRTYEFDPFEQEFYETMTQNCTKPGPICDDCLTLYICIQIGSGFIKEKLEDCSPGTCLDSAAACTTGPNVACHDDGVNYTFTCHQSGIFPDPFDCQKYHFCLPDGTEDGVQPESFVKRCSGTYYYDPKTTLCRKKLYNNPCPVIVPPCTAVGQSGVIPNNPAMYYVCLRGPTTVPFPNLFYCPDGMVFDDTASKVCISSLPVPPVGADGRCVKEGKFHFFYSCLYYYDCPHAGSPAMSTACGNKMHFDHISQKCVDFTCDDVDYN